MKNTNLFQYCQKIVVFSEDLQSVLLCKRKEEEDFDGIFSFIGGKMETTDENILQGLKREKNEEIGANCKIKIYTKFTTQEEYKKKDGNFMILPHFYSIYVSGEIELNEEYSEYKWVKIDELDSFEPKIPTIIPVVNKLKHLKQIIKETDFVII